MTPGRKPLFEGLDDLPPPAPGPRPVDMVAIDRAAIDNDFPSRQPAPVTQDSQPIQPSPVASPSPVIQASSPNPDTQDKQVKARKSPTRPAPAPATPAQAPAVEEPVLMKQVFGNKVRLSAYLPHDFALEVHRLIARERRKETEVVSVLIRLGFAEVQRLTAEGKSFTQLY